MKKYIQKLKGQTCWKILKHFGYDSNLLLRKQLWDDRSMSDDVFKVARSFELRQEAITYLKKLFNMHSIRTAQGGAKVLDQQGIEKVFSTCATADGLPFDARKETQFDSGLTLELWIGLWQKVFCEKPKQAFKFLVYTGFIGGQMKDVIQPIHIKTRDILGQGNQHRRIVFNVFVIGHSQSGKTSLQDAIIKTISSNDELNNESDALLKMQRSPQENSSGIRSVINAYRPGGKQTNRMNGNLADGVSKFIIFTAIPDHMLQDVLQDQQMMNRCDAIALLYENDKDHLDFIRDCISKLPQLKPKVLIQTKMDLIQQQSEQITFQDDLAKELGGIKVYKQISVKAGKFQEAIDAVMQVCMDPSKGLTD